MAKDVGCFYSVVSKFGTNIKEVTKGEDTGRLRKTWKRQDRKPKAIYNKKRKYQTKQTNNKWVETGINVCGGIVWGDVFGV